MSVSPGMTEFKRAKNQILWAQRYLYEYDCLSPQPTPKLAAKSGQGALSVAPNFFSMVRGLLLDAAVMVVARLLDTSKSNGKNLTMGVAIEACV